MKNRLIYGLISLMSVALIGIIAVQAFWISEAISEQEKVFSTHVNDALNHVNNSISEDEAHFFIENSLGGVDSLLKDVFIVEKEKITQDNIISIDNSDSPSHRSIQFKYTSDDDSELDFFNDSLNEMISRMEIKIHQIESTLDEEIRNGKMDESVKDHVTSMVEHYSFEKIFSGDISERISKKELELKIEEALKKESLSTEYDFGIYNVASEEFDTLFSSTNFSPQLNGDEFTKDLFPRDRLDKKQFQLVLQMQDRDKYVWNEVGVQAGMAGLFTLLILICFGFSLYFIFKQKKISQVKNDLINNMTHELKTPLASISLAASSIKHPKVIKDPLEVEKLVHIIENEKQRMNAHVERVLDIAALDKSDLQLNFTTLNLDDLIQNNIQNIKLALDEIAGGCTFNNSLNSASVKGDSYHLNNVISNILDNSIKYSDGDLKIAIDLKLENQYYVLSFADNGIGMSSKTKDLAFDKFFRAESGNIHNRKGFGLGLSYVKKIVEAHSGTVKLGSQLDKGTTLTIKLPR